ncbi:MAG: hypothetical protein SWQ30_11165 [Thermodesulfobacteriota bacterium]|nr:hypothetical protein [Thermodesulfobacteriota bacterium]
MSIHSASQAIWLVDTTLRDGEQAPGVNFSRKQKVTVARMLDRIGLDELEIGIPAMGRDVQEDMRALSQKDLSCRLTAWCRARQEDIDMAARCSVDSVHMSFPVSAIHLGAMGKTESWVENRLNRLVPLAGRCFDHVSVGAQDATRAKEDFLVRFARWAKEAGAERLRIADTVGIARPLQVARMVKDMTENVPGLLVEFHGHNDLGMATANAVTAAEAGAKALSVTVNGLGERAGNVPLEEIALALKGISKESCRVKTRGLKALCAYVARASKRPIPIDKAVTGAVAFTHESGIHCAALLKEPETYEPFSPDTVGRGKSTFLLGTHSGSSLVCHLLREADISIDRCEARLLLDAIRDLAREKGAVLSQKELIGLYHDRILNCS